VSLFKGDLVASFQRSSGFVGSCAEQLPSFSGSRGSNLHFGRSKLPHSSNNVTIANMCANIYANVCAMISFYFVSFPVASHFVVMNRKLSNKISRSSNTGQNQRILQNRSSRSANPHKHRKTELQLSWDT